MCENKIAFFLLKQIQRSNSYHNLSDYDDEENNDSIDYLSGKAFPTVSSEFLDDNCQYINTNSNNSAQLLLAQQKQRLNTLQFDDDRKYRQVQNDVSGLLFVKADEELYFLFFIKG